jgi:hypothetical protein
VNIANGNISGFATATLQVSLKGGLPSALSSDNLKVSLKESIRFFGETQVNVGSDIKLFGSNTSGGTFYYLNNGDLMATTLTIGGVSKYYIGGSFENIPRYIKFFNNNASTGYKINELYMVGSGGRVAV